MLGCSKFVALGTKIFVPMPLALVEFLGFRKQLQQNQIIVLKQALSEVSGSRFSRFRGLPGLTWHAIQDHRPKSPNSNLTMGDPI